MPNELPQNPGNERLDSWKEIASFFARDERTVKRWEKERGLPVHRVPGGGRGTVFAFTAELSAWLRSSQMAGGSVTVSEGESVLAAPGSLEKPTAVSGADESGASDWMSENAVRRWGLLTFALLAIFLGIYGLGRFIQIGSVQGHVLPNISFSRNVSSRHEAEDLYLKGRYHWNKRTAVDLTQAADYFSAAAQRDPSYAAAYAGIADSYNLLREYSSMPASQAFPLALAAGQKAVQLDDSLAEGHRALAFTKFHWQWDIRGGEREFRRAIELNPNDAVAHHWYATALLALPRYPEAISEIETARALDPGSRSIAADRALIFYSSGREQEGLEILQDLEKTDPDFLSPHAYLGRIYADRKDYRKSLDEREILAKMSRDDRELAEIAVSRQRLKTGGDGAYLEGLLADRLQEFNQGRGDALAVADAYTLLGRKKETLEFLEKAYQRHEYGLLYLRNNKHYAFLADDPAYQNLLQRIDQSKPQS
jgi:Tfp pilus assembly protein PilF